ASKAAWLPSMVTNVSYFRKLRWLFDGSRCRPQNPDIATRDREAKHMASQASVASGDLTQKIRAATDELNELQHVVRTGTVDMRVLVEFRQAMNHARQASAAVRQWVEEEAKNGDPYVAVRFVEAERIRGAIEMMRELCHDVDGGAIDHGTTGINDLRAAAKTLIERLARF